MNDCFNLATVCKMNLQTVMYDELSIKSESLGMNEVDILAL